MSKAASEVRKTKQGLELRQVARWNVVRGHVNEIAMVRDERLVIFHLGLQ
jgi:hypothetical protein